jgi:hypothetical protein
MNSGFMASGNIADHSTAEEVFALVNLKPKFGSSSSCSSIVLVVVVLVLELHARERYQPVGSIDHGLFDPHRSHQRPRTRTTTRTRTIEGSGGGLRPHDCGYRLSQSDRSIGVSVATTCASISLPGSCLVPSFPNRPRSVGVFYSEESPIVSQLFCPVSLMVKHRVSRGRRTTTSTSPQFRSLG